MSSDLDGLPGDPIKFFGLEDDFDRRDLKRAYGKAIRKYKPETHPAEFGLIREAYERLEKSLRYGRKMQSMAEASDAWSTEEPSPSATTQDPDQSASKREQASSGTPERRSPEPRTPSGPASRPAIHPRPEPTLRQLAVADPVAAMTKLESKVRRTPQDYYLAAILADATAMRSTSKYLGHLVDGLLAFPDDPGLTSLATEFLRTEIPDAMLGKTIDFIAKTIATPLFYVLTESLWLRWVEAVPFEQVQTLLDRCDRLIRQDDPSIRATFQLRLMRSAIWTAPEERTQLILDELESQSAMMDYSAQMDLQFLVDLQALLRRGKPTDPIRQKLLSAVRASCRYDETQSVAEVNQTLDEVPRDSSAFRKSFPVGSSEVDAPWAGVIDNVVDQLVSYRDQGLHDHDDPSVDEDRLTTQSFQLIKDLTQDVATVVRGVDQAKFRYKQVPMLLWLITLPVVGMLPLMMIAFAIDARQGSPVVILVGLILLIAGVIWSFFGWLYPKKLAPREDAFKQNRLIRDYNQHWRARLFRFSQACGEPIQVQCIRIAQMGQQTNQGGISDLAIHFIRQDAGLLVFATLQRVLR